MPSEQISEVEAEDMHRVKVIEEHKKVLGAATERAIAYTNLITVAGYAGFFALWQITKDYLSRNQVLWSAVLMLTSLALFVLFEVCKAYYSSRAVMEYAAILHKPENRGSLVKLEAQIERFRFDEQKRFVWFGRSWHVVFILTALSGLGGAGILVYALVRALCA